MFVPSFYVFLIQHIKSNSNSNKEQICCLFNGALEESKGNRQNHILYSIDILMKARNAGVYNAYIF